MPHALVEMHDAYDFVHAPIVKYQNASKTHIALCQIPHWTEYLRVIISLYIDQYMFCFRVHSGFGAGFQIKPKNKIKPFDFYLPHRVSAAQVKFLPPFPNAPFAFINFVITQCKAVQFLLLC